MLRTPPVDCVVRSNYVSQRVGLSITTIKKMIGEGKFPTPLQLNPGKPCSPIGWFESEIDAWLASRPRGLSPGPSWAWRANTKAANKRRGPTPKIDFRRGDTPIPAKVNGDEESTI